MARVEVINILYFGNLIYHIDIDRLRVIQQFNGDIFHAWLSSNQRAQQVDSIYMYFGLEPLVEH